jgi:DNA polymerase-1
MIKLAMTNIRTRLSRERVDACMVNCVHDEVLLEAAEGDAWDVADFVTEEMVEAGERFIKSVPVAVDVVVGESWQK